MLKQRCQGNVERLCRDKDDRKTSVDDSDINLYQEDDKYCIESF
jgi:hypothetical protein